MAYCLIADVQTLIKWLTFAAGTKVTSTEVTDFHIAEADKFIDDKLSARYTVPITNTNDIKTLKYISERLAAVEAAMVLAVQAGGDIVEVVEQWKKDALARLELILTGATPLETTPITSSLEQTANGLWSYTACDPDAPEIQWKLGKDEDMW